METLSILAHFLSKEEKKLLKRKGFKLIRTSHIPTGLYEGLVYVVSIPKSLKVFGTTHEDTFLICNSYVPIMRITYHYYNLGGIVSFNKDDAFWR